MASRPTETPPIGGRVDREGVLVAADPPLERLQVEAGSKLGRPLALPQLAALARAAASLGVPLSRALLAADSRHDIDLFVRAVPDGDDVVLTIERWAARPAPPPRLTLVQPIDDDQSPTVEASELAFETDAALNIIAVTPRLAGLVGRDPAGCVGQPLTGLFRLVEEEDGQMPLLAALASRGPVEGQRALVRGGDGEEIRIDAEPVIDQSGKFAGFQGKLRADNELLTGGATAGGAFEESLDDALRSPLVQIISAADRIVERSDGPLRSDYANYASDIAAAGRHLLSVIRSMGEGVAAAAQAVDLAELAAEAIALVQPLADARSVRVALVPSEVPIAAAGEARAIVQVLVNIMGNAIRHSPDGSAVAVTIERDEDSCRVAILDQGPGIAPDDQQRIFERYERATDHSDGSGLGLAISRRLARSMGGDIRLDSAPGAGARFTLVLPSE